ncbi:hypothetical protein GGI22_007533, partial [Coemansia erecta]
GVGQTADMSDQATNGAVQAQTTPQSNQSAPSSITDSQAFARTDDTTVSESPSPTAAKAQPEQKTECSAAGVEDWNRNLQIGG